MSYGTEVPIPPAPNAVGDGGAIDRLWVQLSLERRQAALRTLSRVVAQQLEPTPAGKEVNDERTQRQGA